MTTMQLIPTIKTLTGREDRYHAAGVTGRTGIQGRVRVYA